VALDDTQALHGRIVEQAHRRTEAIGQGLDQLNPAQ
jgi:hypothetical protein